MNKRIILIGMVAALGLTAKAQHNHEHEHDHGHHHDNDTTVVEKEKQLEGIVVRSKNGIRRMVGAVNGVSIHKEELFKAA
ncbi:MAG: hypothetical protein IKD19_08105, partial [Prevotella sp.]|nr:hypothetical protein [Prevotella sp.]